MQSQPPQAQSWGSIITSLLPCLGRRGKPDAGRRPLESQAEPAAVQLTKIETNSSNFNWGPLDATLAGLEGILEVFPPLKVALGGLREVVRNTEITRQNIQEYNQLVLDLKSLIDALERYIALDKPIWTARSVAIITRSLEKETAFIKAHQARSKASAFRHALQEDHRIIQSYRRIESLFRQLQIDISLSTWDSVREQHINSLLDKLQPVLGAWYDAEISAEAYRGSCTPGTREGLIGDLLDWASLLDTFNVYWMSGMPGTGKTTVAYTLSAVLESGKQLGACFFCSRLTPDCRDANRVFPTIAYQLAQFSNPYRNKLFEVLSTTSNIAQRKIVVQFEQLILGPLLSIKEDLSADIVVVIDALDECSGNGEQILSLLLKHAAQIPIKFFVTSRPEPGLTRQIDAPQTNSSHKVFHLHEIEKSLVQADITVYLQKAFEGSTTAATPEDIERLAEYAGNLFIVAATTVRYILGNGSLTLSSRSRERMKATLTMASTGKGTGKQRAAIDTLYKGILVQVLERGELEEEDADEIRRILWVTLCVREPISIESLSKILAREPSTVYEAVGLLQSVLHLSEKTKMVSTLHASFPEFMFSKERAGRFHCKRQDQEDYLLRRCFDIMDKHLRFNICDLTTSYLADNHVPKLEDRVTTHIAWELFYACRYWADHLQSVPFSEQTAISLENFLYKYLLFWVEVINLKGWASNGAAMMALALKWLPPDGYTGLADLGRAIRDAKNFITSFSANQVAQSTPHLYLSSLSASSKYSKLLTTHRGRFRGLPDITSSAMEEMGGAGALAVWTVASSVFSVAVSPDGTQLASSSHNGSIHIWDIGSGEVILDLTGGHSSFRPVCSVAFSPNGCHLVSGSIDGTICIWDIVNVGLLVKPISEHEGAISVVTFAAENNILASASEDGIVCVWDTPDGAVATLRFKIRDDTSVTSISFSPDGLRIASAGSSSTIRLRNTENSTMLIAPIEGHTGPVQCVRFSPDGLRLASASKDKTVRIWNPDDGTMLAGPFQVHTDGLAGISFSPDAGALIACALADATIRVLNTQTGALVSGPFSGHTSIVNAVHFLPDSTQIVSGSEDGTIRIWDAQYSFQASNARSSGHKKGIRSIALSPNGSQMASSSQDCTVCVWDLTSGTLLLGPLHGHDEDVYDVTFSPNGETIVSGSLDKTIRVWDASTGEPVGRPLTGHAHGVITIQFSPDGSQLASGARDGAIHIWDLRKAEVSSRPGMSHTDAVWSASFSPDGSYVASGSDDFSVCLWDVQKSRSIWKGSKHTGGVNSTIFSPDGRFIASGSDDLTVLLWDVQTGTIIGGPLAGHTRIVMSVRFSPDGKTIASGSLDHTIRLWDISKGELKLPPFEGHSGVNSIAFTLDGNRLVSGLYDGSIRVWDTTLPEQTDDVVSWVSHEGGWVTDQNSRLLVWLPQDLRSRLFPHPRNILTILAGKTIAHETPDIKRFLIGERWQNCYLGPGH